MFRTALIALVGFGFSAGAAERVDYLKEVKPVLAARCYACHGALKQEAKLRVDTAEFIRKGGKHGPAIVAGKPDASLLLKKVSAHSLDERMPPEGEPLHAPQIAVLRAWIAAGALAPKDEKPESDPREHWAFKAPLKGVVPWGQKVISEEVISRQPGRAKPASAPSAPLITNHFPTNFSPVDAFLEAQRRQQKLTAQPPADPALWLRRITLDLTGLPPTRAEIDAFVRDFSLTPSHPRTLTPASGESEKARKRESEKRARTAVVDRLLASPHYGERWGRHFMDIWRYSDWWGLGAQLRYSQKHIWHWRDWIVESLNADKGYDRMMVEQLAGDELAPTDPATLRATGFLARNYYLFNRTTWMDDVVEHTSKAFLGLTLNCSKCHDHKYDPLSHTDYYAMRAIFEPYHARLDELPGETDLEKNGLPRAYDLHLDRSTYIHLKGDEKTPDTNHVIRAAIPAVLAFKQLDIKPVQLPAPAHNPALQPWVLTNHLRAAEEQLTTARQAVEAAKQKLAEVERNGARTTTSAAAKPDVGVRAPAATPEQARAALKAAELTLAAAELRPAMVRAAWEADFSRSQSPAPTSLTNTLTAAASAEAKFKLAQAEADLAKAELETISPSTDPKKKKEPDAEKKLKTAQEALAKAQKAVAAPGTNYTSLRATLKPFEGPDETEAHRQLPYPTTSTGRRLAFANWLADRQNPLTARVLVNHVWTRHFGQPLVANVTDFGRRAAKPLHADLLDWLAVDFMEHGWSLKHLHRRIVLSEAYGMASTYAGVSVRGFEGPNSPSPSPSPPLPLSPSHATDPENKFYWRMNPQRMDANVLRDSLLHLAGTLDLKLGGPTIDPKREDTLRRSFYFTQSPEDLNKFLEMFDNANTKECYRRDESILPQQALALANSRLASTAAAKVAERLVQDAASAPDDAFIRTTFTTLLATVPTPAEHALCAESLAQFLAAAKERKSAQPEAKARAALVHALLNHNDFITIR